MYSLPKSSFHLRLHQSNEYGVYKLRRELSQELAKAIESGAFPQQIEVLRNRFVELDQDDQLRKRLLRLQNEYYNKRNLIIDEALSRALNSLSDPSNSSELTYELIPESSWKEMLELCKFINFSKEHPNTLYKKFKDFTAEIEIRSEAFLNSEKPIVKRLISSLKLVLQKSHDNFQWFVPLLLKIFKCEVFTTDMNEKFVLDKMDYSYYFAIDYTVQRILKAVERWEVEAAMTRNAILVLILWEAIPEFGVIFLCRLFEQCPYALPYIPRKEGNATVSLEAREHILALYIRFQAKIMLLPNEAKLYGIYFCWQWFLNVFKILEQPDYEKQNFCFVLREFLNNVQEHLKEKDSNVFYRVIRALDKKYLPKLAGIDPSKDFLQAHISNILKA